LVHAYAGGTVVGVILFRILWGMMGTRHARFGSFVRGPGAALGYLKGLLSGRAAHTAGHNPAGGWAIVALLLLGLLTGASGWLMYQDIGGDLLEEVHEVLATTMLTVALLHLVGVIVGSLAHHENLVRAMLTGLKRGPPDEAIVGARPLIALLMLGWIAAIAWWIAQ
jgi:cytochrome b